MASRAGWHHGLDGRESEGTLGDGDGQEGLACCSPLGHKELGRAWRLNNNGQTQRDPGLLTRFCMAVFR